MNKLFQNKSNPNVLYIHSDIFNKMSNLENHVRNLHESSCGTDVSLCSQNPCNSYLVVYLDEIVSLIKEFQNDENFMDISEDTDYSFNLIAQKIEDKYYKYISSFLTLEIFPNINEIYNVCSNKSSRGKGNMKEIFQALLEDFNQKNIWLGISLDNPFFKIALHLYTSVGFSPITIDFASPHDNITYKPFLSMLYKQNENHEDFDKKINEIKGIEIVKKFNQNKGKCNINVFLQPEKLNYIYDNFSTESTEFAGVMKRKKKNQEFLLEINQITKGGNEFTVDIPLDLINWHTHPFICHITYECFISWPSGKDFAFSFMNYRNGVVGHFLFTEEGVYFLQLNPILMFLLRFLSYDCIDNIRNIIGFRFSKLEEFRKIKYDPERLKCLENEERPECYTYDSRIKRLSINKTLEIVNTFTLAELLKKENTDLYEVALLKEKIDYGCLQRGINLANSTNLGLQIKNLNFPIFKMTFTKLTNAKKEGVKQKIDFFIPPTEAFCPI